MYRMFNYVTGAASVPAVADVETVAGVNEISTSSLSDVVSVTASFGYACLIRVVVGLSTSIFVCECEIAGLIFF